MKIFIIVLVLLGAGAPFSVIHGGSMIEKEKDLVEMAHIPAGTYIRGSAPGEGRLDEQPKRKIYLKGFAIDKFEVSNARYIVFLEETLHKPPLNVHGDGPLSSQKNIDDLPVVQVTWHDAVDYCFWAGKRLPTEAEWEKAARGNDDRSYPWGNERPTPKRAQFEREWNEGKTLQSVNSFPNGQSSSGVYQLSGNVREWTQDWYQSDYYSTSPDKNPQGPKAGILKSIRGGSWKSFDSDIRVTARGKGGFALKTHGIGFRCAKDLPPSPHLDLKVTP